MIPQDLAVTMLSVHVLGVPLTLYLTTLIGLLAPISRPSVQNSFVLFCYFVISLLSLYCKAIMNLLWDSLYTCNAILVAYSDMHKLASVPAKYYLYSQFGIVKVAMGMLIPPSVMTVMAGTPSCNSPFSSTSLFFSLAVLLPLVPKFSNVLFCLYECLLCYDRNAQHTHGLK